MTHREEVEHHVSFSCWPRRCPQALLESPGLSFTDFIYSFMFSSSFFLFYVPPLNIALLHKDSSSPGLGGQGRGAAVCKPGTRAADWLVGMLQEQRDLFLSLGREGNNPLQWAPPPLNPGLGRVQPRWEHQGCACVRKQRQGWAADNPIPLDPLFPKH